MTLEEKKKIRKRLNYILLGILILALVFVLFVTVIHRMPVYVFQIGLITALVLAVLVTNVLEPYWYGLFKNFTQERQRAYFTTLFLECVGIAGIAYFLVNLGTNNKTRIFGIVVYLLTGTAKRKAKDAFYGEVKYANPEQSVIEGEAREVGSEEVEEKE